MSCSFPSSRPNVAHLPLPNLALVDQALTGLLQLLKVCLTRRNRRACTAWHTGTQQSFTCILDYRETLKGCVPRKQKPVEK